MRILVTGDIHLGRRSSRLGAAADRREDAASGAWRRLVRLAIREQVDLVAISGDVVDQSNRFYEALGPLEAGLADLAEAQIPCLAVAGNHDHSILPQLADQLAPDAASTFHLLGRGGTWERFTLTQRGKALCIVHGWSFPDRSVTSDPTAQFAADRHCDLPQVVLLHGDLDQADSRYAPLSRSRLRSQPVAAWVLGHIHQPDSGSLDDGPLVLYPGSPQALDPGEPGKHGPWLLTLDGTRITQAVHMPLSTVRYQSVTIAVSPDQSPDELVRATTEALNQCAGTCQDESGDSLARLALRVRFEGEADRALRAAAMEQCERLMVDGGLTFSGVPTIIEKVTIDLRPAVDLAALARDDHAAGLVAQLRAALEADGPLPAPHDDLLAACRDAAAQVGAGSAYASLQPPSDGGEAEDAIDDARLREILAAQTRQLLTALLDQQEGA